jgi:hypothetical protein
MVGPATSIFRGDTGISAANIKMTGPTQVIIGLESTGAAAGGSQWIMRPIPAAQATM